jgi:hypothetical protein
MSNSSNTPFKRQWGAEKNLKPLPILHDKPSALKIISSRAAIVLTITFWLTYLIYTVIKQFFDGPHKFQFTIQAVSYLALVTFLTFSALMYLVARQGAFQRFSKHVRVPRANEYCLMVRRIEPSGGRRATVRPRLLRTQIAHHGFL